MLLKYRMNSKMYYDLKAYYNKLLKMNLAQVEYDYKVYLTEESNRIYKDNETQQKINNEYLNKLKCDLNISKLEVEQFKKGIREFMEVHPNIKYPIIE